jgi:hypothetical protein
MGRKRDHLSSNTSRPDSATKRTLTFCHACLRRASLERGNDRIGERAFFRPLLLFVLSYLGKRSLRYQMHTGRSYVYLGRTFCFAQRLHDVGVTVVEEAAGFGVQRPDRRHIFRAKREIEDVEVFHDSFLTD